ncbi:MAG: helix-turn-helix domain-containing protein, partial [Rhodocyclaceae bacterium]|nr:helix-turn-helix domain-containing protein [Rhodocyclaceae bacterium]
MTETSKNRERARAALAALGISQAELARALSVSPQIVSGVLRGNLSG